MRQDKIQKVVVTVLFALLGFLLMQVPFSKIVGSNLKFSLFDFYGPIAGGFLGGLWGLATVLAMQIANWVWHGFAIDGATIIRFFPMLFSVLYFARKSKWILLVSALAMIAFWIHPEGRQAWYYALYWLIPIAAFFFHEKYLLARALGATFTAHAVGGALWIWTFNMKASVWISLIPIVWKERIVMAIGITATYIFFNYLLSLLARKAKIQLPFVKLNPKYALRLK